MKNVAEIKKQLEDGVKSFKNGDAYKQWLSTVSKFHSYSLNNLILIAIQKPDAQQVAGYQTWKKLGRQIKHGEKGIKILAPCPYKKTLQDENGEEVEVKAVGFRAVSVFDISQTEGKELPTIAKTLEGNVEAYQVLIDRLIEIAPVPVRFDTVDGTKKGYCTESEIVVKEGMSETQTVKTLTHELAHSVMHWDGAERSREQKETEAESVAFIVCDHLGIDTSDYSFAYLASWGADKEFKTSLDAIVRTSKAIIDKLEEKKEAKAA